VGRSCFKYGYIMKWLLSQQSFIYIAMPCQVVAGWCVIQYVISPKIHFYFRYDKKPPRPFEVNPCSVGKRIQLIKFAYGTSDGAH